MPLPPQGAPSTCENSFQLFPTEHTIELVPKRVNQLTCALKRSKLYSRSMEDVYNIFNRATREGEHLTEKQFRVCLAQLCTGREHDELATYLVQVFELYAQDSDTVAVLKLAILCALFVKGTVEYKIRYIFNSGLSPTRPIAHSHAIRCFEAILSAIEAIWNHTISHTMINTCAVSCVERLFEQQDVLHQPLEELITENTTGLWLRLLNVLNWTTQTDLLNSNDWAFTFSIAKTTITETHAKAMATYLQQMKLSMTCEELYQSCLSQAVDGSLDLDSFRICMANSTAFDSLFRHYTRDFTQFVDAMEIAAGLSLFLSGSKSDKLQTAFYFFDQDEDGALTCFELWRFLRSIMIMLLALDPSCASPVATIVEKESQQVMSRIGTVQDSFTFTDFGDWYNNKNGYCDFAWLELLDLRKWCFVWPQFSLPKPIQARVILDFGYPLVFDTTDIAQYRTTMSQLNHLSIQMLYDTIFQVPTMDKPLFDQTLVKKSINDQYLGDRLFYGYDRFGTGKLKAMELFIGCSIFCSGTKSEKLAFAFNLVDADHDGYISRRELWIFLRSFLTILCILSSSDMSPVAIAVYVDQLAISVASVVFSTGSTTLSFQQFAEWYTDGAGHTQIQWIELLDTKKWPIVTETVAPPSRSSKAVSSLAFQFSLVPHDTLLLKIKMRDVAFVLELAEKLNFQARSCAKIYRTFEVRYITSDLFSQTIRSFAPRTHLSDTDQLLFSKYLQRVFTLYEEDGLVDTVQLLCGLSVLCHGSKSDKLVFLFDLYENLLTRRELYDFFRSLLKFLLSFSSSTRVCCIAEKTAGVLTSRVFSETKAEDEIDLAQFAEWYSTIGCDCIPWIELMDLTKWPTGINTSPPLTEEYLSFDYSELDVSLFLRFVETTRLRYIDTQMLHDTLYDHATNSDSITRAEYYDWIRAVVTGTEKQTMTLLNRLFDIYTDTDDSSSDAIALIEIACGMTLVGHGSKSDKLLMAFTLFCDSNGCISQANLFLFFRSFLLALIALSKASDSTPALVGLIDRVAQEATDSVVSEVSLENRAHISFEDFGDWYNNGGYECVPWIELLDIVKWEKQMTFSAAVAEENSLLAFAPSTDGAELNFQQSDIETLREILQETKLHQFSPAALVNELITSANIPETLCQLANITEFQHSAIKDVFIQLQDCLDSHENLCCGILLFSDGTLKEKLIEAMKLCDTLENCLYCFLTTLYILGTKGSREIICQSAAEGAKEAIHVFHEDTLEMEDTVQAFTEWFECRGHCSLSWIELIELVHWPVAFHIIDN